jgi:hypothetical protein
MLIVKKSFLSTKKMVAIFAEWRVTNDVAADRGSSLSFCARDQNSMPSVR